MTHYYGLTLGPILSTLGRVSSTKELWGASYLFSHLMRLIVQRAEAQRMEILLPYPQLPAERAYPRAGLFPDRLILAATENQRPQLQALITEAIAELGEGMVSHGKDLPSNLDAQTMTEGLRQYLQTYLVSLSADQPAEAVQALNDLMDVAELRQPFQRKAKDQWLFDYLDGKLEYFIQVAFGDEANDERRIRSLPEIAASDLASPHIMPDFESRVARRWWQQNVKEQRKQERGMEIEVLDLYQYIQEHHRADLVPHLKTYHRYIAVVQADGDNIGQTVKLLRDQKEVRTFSRELLDFGLAAEEKIRAFKGQLVYAGGDDLLFFAPVMYDGNSIFWLCDQLNQLFVDAISTRSEVQPTLSFGVSISYHKFPLYEALETAQHLLFGRAKQHPGKNAIAYQLLKHSGQHFGQVFSRESETYGLFKNLLKREMKTEERFLSSVMYLLERQKTVFDQFGKSEEPGQGVDTATRAKRIAYLFKHNYDEAPHEGPAKDYLSDVQNLIVAAYEDYPLKKDVGGEEARRAVYSALRTIHFLKQTHDD